MILTVDANVFVSAALRHELHHAASQAFLDVARTVSVDFRCPTLLPVEVAASVARVTGDDALAMRTLHAVRRRPRLRLASLTGERAQRAAELATIHRLRGADAVCLATATEYAAVLITWDTELLQRGPAVSPVMTPDDWLHSAH